MPILVIRKKNWCTQSNIQQGEYCSNDTDIKELILLMKDTPNLCKEIKNERLDLKNRVETLEEKMKTA